MTQAACSSQPDAQAEHDHSPSYREAAQMMKYSRALTRQAEWAGTLCFRSCVEECLLTAYLLSTHGAAGSHRKVWNTWCECSRFIWYLFWEKRCVAERRREGAMCPSVFVVYHSLAMKGSAGHGERRIFGCAFRLSYVELECWLHSKLQGTSFARLQCCLLDRVFSYVLPRQSFLPCRASTFV